MVLLSNCLSDSPDEGCLKVANSLAKRIKQSDGSILVVSTGRSSSLTDVHLDINKMLLSTKLIRMLKERSESLLYIPFPTRSLPNAIRIFWLSLISPKDLRVVMTMTYPYSWPATVLLKLSKARVYALSKAASVFYSEILRNDRVVYLQTGVDTKRFSPASKDAVQTLKRKYGLDVNRKTVLHVGHLSAGRNIAQLMKLDPEYQILLVVSTFTREFQDLELKKQLESHGSITIIDSYLPNIEELYQLADVYFFPVVEPGQCIDVPLSCLEAAACGTPVVTTKYGEMNELVGKPGFYFLDSMDASELNAVVAAASEDKTSASRSSVQHYDWSNAVLQLLK